MKILFLVPYPTEGASNRLRVEQYLPFLRQEGIEYRVRPFVSRGFYRILYLRGHYIKKVAYFILCTINRLFDIIRAINFDIVFIHREAYPIGPPVIESLLRMLGKKIIFDFDDAIFLPSTSKTNVFVERFKNPNKVANIIRMSDYVIAGNAYLKNYADKFNKNIAVIPTPIDTDRYSRVPNAKKEKERIVIGWMGSVTTQDYLESMKEVFLSISREFHSVHFKIVGGKIDLNGVKNVEFKEWRLEEEIPDLLDFDIGIMPMPDDHWTRGKCGFKIILYMSMGIATVCSPVGVNTDIIKDGENGFLAEDSREWVDKLSRLIKDTDTRGYFSRKGRELAEHFYSLKVNAPQFIGVLKKTHAKN